MDNAQPQAEIGTMDTWWTDESARQEAMGDFVVENGLGVQDMPENPYEDDSAVPAEETSEETPDMTGGNDEVTETDVEIEGDAEAAEAQKQKAAKDKQDKAKADMLGEEPDVEPQGN
jgi:hypothetical protein